MFHTKRSMLHDQVRTFFYEKILKSLLVEHTIHENKTLKSTHKRHGRELSLSLRKIVVFQ